MPFVLHILLSGSSPAVLDQLAIADKLLDSDVRLLLSILEVEMQILIGSVGSD